MVQNHVDCALDSLLLCQRAVCNPNSKEVLLQLVGKNTTHHYASNPEPNPKDLHTNDLFHRTVARSPQTRTCIKNATEVPTEDLIRRTNRYFPVALLCLMLLAVLSTVKAEFDNCRHLTSEYVSWLQQ
ncbi:MAG: hypothetical protein J3R72DRAFT_426732 [Linnemannia gamsii]|nr:MAG: hypothetical protein J3R72DRAFT_426732 [Linnemannia gamsii]